MRIVISTPYPTEAALKVDRPVSVLINEGFHELPDDSHIHGDDNDPNPADNPSLRVASPGFVKQAVAAMAGVARRSCGLGSQ